MLETVKMQKRIHADREVIWAELLKAEFAKDFLPEIKSTKSKVLPSYSIAGKLLSWHNIGRTSLAMENRDLKANIVSIDLELEQISNETIVNFEISLNNKFDIASITRYKAIRTIFEIKLAVLKEKLELNQTNWSPAFN